jgi:hypothetical protein
VVNHYGLVSVTVDFFMAPSIPGADDGSDQVEAVATGVKPGYGPRLSPGAVESARASRRATEVGFALHWAPPNESQKENIFFVLFPKKPISLRFIFLLQIF